MFYVVLRLNCCRWCWCIDDMVETCLLPSWGNGTSAIITKDSCTGDLDYFPTSSDLIIDTSLYSINNWYTIMHETQRHAKSIVPLDWFLGWKGLDV